jgi:type II secretory pathway pseudopilin PulG
MKRGYTLIETIVVMTGGSALLGIAVVLLCVLFRADGSWRDHVQRSVTIDRLSERFRRDVRAAAGPPAAVAQQPGRWDVPLAADGMSHFVTYQVENGRVVRNVRESTRPDWIEEYALPAGATARIETEPLGDATLARLEIAPLNAAAGGRTFRVEAVVGRDRRFVHAQQGEK